MARQPNMKKLQNLRVIAERLVEIASTLTSDYKLTFVARVPGEHAKTIIVTDDEDLTAAAGELTSSDDLLIVTRLTIQAAPESQK